MGKKIKTLISILKLFLQINWIKTVYINFKKLPLYTAIKLPIIIFGKCAFKNLNGKIILEGPVFFGRVGIGQKYQIFVKEKGVSELHIIGELRIKGRVQISTDCKMYIGEKAICTLGDMTSIGSDSSLICTKNISLGEFCQTGSEGFITDSNFHSMKNTLTGEIYPKSFEISIGNYNFIGTRVTIMGKTKTPDYCTIASCSLVNKDFTPFNQNILIGGTPAKLLKENITRDWDGERLALEKYMTIL